LQSGHPLNPIRQRCLSSLLIADRGVIGAAGIDRVEPKALTAADAVVMAEAVLVISHRPGCAAHKLAIGERDVSNGATISGNPWRAAQVPTAQPDLGSPAENNHA
jgi:hypothetical protein